MERTRRRLLGAVGAAGTAATAGCLGLGIFGPSLPSCSGEQVTDVAVPTRGAADAPVRIEVFSDFACPHCKTFAEEAAPRIDDLVESGDVLYVHRDFPVPVSGRSFPVANAARAVAYLADDAAFWAYYDRLFADQGAFGTDRLADHAAAVGAPAGRVRAAVENLSFCETVKRDRSAGSDRGVEGTPTAFVAGERYGGPDADEFEAAVREAVER